MNDQLIKDYQNGKSLAQCSREYRLSVKEIKKILNSNNIHIRTRQEQTVYTNKARAKKINHQYFDELTEEKAYYLGFIAADGSISKRDNEIKIALSSVDHYWLEELRTKMESERKVKKSVTNNGFEISSFQFSSEPIKNKLKEYSIVPNKTYTGITMKSLPTDSLKWAFFKGYFDGDGSFSWNKNTKQGTFKIASYKREILNEFKQLIEKYYNLHIGIYCLKRKTGPIYSMEISTVGSLIILKRFYEEVNSPCLLRKKEKYNDFLDYRIENLSPRAKAAFNTKVENVCSPGLEKTNRKS